MRRLAIVLTLFVLFCARSDEPDYDCTQSEGLVFDGLSNYRDTACTNIPNAIQIRLLDTTIPIGGQLVVRAFSSSNDNGIYIGLTPNQIKTAAADGNAGAATFSANVDFTAPKNACFEIHDVTKEKHILAVYPSADCIGSPVINSGNELFTFGENRVRYAGSPGVSLRQLRITKAAAHLH